MGVFAVLSSAAADAEAKPKFVAGVCWHGKTCIWRPHPNRIELKKPTEVHMKADPSDMELKKIALQPIKKGRGTRCEFDRRLSVRYTARATGETKMCLPGVYKIVFEAVPDGGFKGSRSINFEATWLP
jgi:hypothetical protein